MLIMAKVSTANVRMENVIMANVLMANVFLVKVLSQMYNWAYLNLTKKLCIQLKYFFVPENELNILNILFQTLENHISYTDEEFEPQTWVF